MGRVCWLVFDKDTLVFTVATEEPPGSLPPGRESRLEDQGAGPIEDQTGPRGPEAVSLRRQW